MKKNHKLTKVVKALVISALVFIILLHIIFLFLGRAWIGTNIAITILIISVIYLLRSKKKQQLLKNIKTISFSIILALFFAEIILRIFFPIYNTYSENNFGGIYISPFSNKYSMLKDKYIFRKQSTHIKTLPASYSYNLKTHDFNIVHKYNELGIRERDNIIELSANKLSILGLGDSFTEGFGSKSEDTWLRQLENILNNNEEDKEFLTINAGISGLDPFYSYKILEELNNFIKPNFIILGIGKNDITDILIRGGFERFHNKSVSFSYQPVGAFLFAFSYIFRALIYSIYDYPELFLNEKQYNDKLLKAEKDLIDVIHKYEEFCIKKDIQFILLLIPDSYEISIGDYQSELFKRIARSHDSFLKTIIVDPLSKQNRLFFSQTNDLSKLYWPVDGHLTREGNRIIAEILFSEIYDYLND